MRMGLPLLVVCGLLTIPLCGCEHAQRVGEDAIEFVVGDSPWTEFGPLIWTLVAADDVDSEWKAGAIAAGSALAGYIVATELGAATDEERKQEPRYQDASALFEEAIEVQPGYPPAEKNLYLMDSGQR